MAEAERAVHAIAETWRFFAAAPREDFGYRTAEPKLTKVMKAYARDVAGPEAGCRGKWTAENVYPKIDRVTGKSLKEVRTDIEYFWMDGQSRMELVFEFKRLTRTAASDKHYLGESGLGRFVDGEYSLAQPMALMVGVLLEPDAAIVNALTQQLNKPDVAHRLRIQAQANGDLLFNPSVLFPAHAEFDTEHQRDSDKAPPCGSIRIAHLFFQFAYSPPPK